MFNHEEHEEHEESRGDSIIPEKNKKLHALMFFMVSLILAWL
jgi:hypothetical protein